MSRIQNSLALAKASWSVLRSERELAWLPVLSFVCSVVAFAILGGMIYATGGHTTAADGTRHFQANAATVLLGICAYIALAFIATYFLAALCAGANERLQGRATSLGEAMRVANTRLHRILPWAVVSATLSIIIQSLEQRFGLLGRIVANVLGAAWNVLTFLTVPIIVFEDVGPIDALKRSGALFKQTWGENLAAQVGLGVLGFVAMLPGMLVIALGAAAGVGAIVVVCVVVGVVWMVLASAVLAALSGIYRTALYRYAVDGRVPAVFADAGVDFAGAFGPRRGGSASRGGFSSGLGGTNGGFSGGGFSV